MFKKQKKHSDLSAYTDHSFIGEQTHLVGDLTFTGGLHLEGSVTGNVESTEGCLHLHGVVTGDVNVPNAVVSGVIRGNVTVHEHLELTADARIEGVVSYQRMEMSLGAQVTGHLQPLSAPLLKAVKDSVA